MKKRIVLTLEIESDEPCPDEELAEEARWFIDHMGSRCEHPMAARLVSFEKLQEPQ